MPDTHAFSRRTNETLVTAFLLFVLAFVSWEHFSVLSAGGSSWQQGDWLINTAAGPVRRGIGGDALLLMSDALGIGPIAATGAVQYGMFLGLLLLIYLAARRLAFCDGVTLLLLSPAFIGFWVNDFPGAFRKEIVALLALALLLVAQRRDGRVCMAVFLLSAILFVVALAIHEGNSFLAPFMLLALFIAARDTSARPLAIALGGVIIVASLASLAFALLQNSVPETAALCAPLMDRGVPADFCSGAISWLDKSFSEGVGSVINMMKTESQISFLQAYALSLIPIYIFLKGDPNGKRLFLMAWCTGVFLLPLYVVAIDWGRWIFVHVTALSLVLMLAAQRGMIVGALRALDRKTFCLCLALSSLYGIDHVGGHLKPGYFVSVELLVKREFGLAW